MKKNSTYDASADAAYIYLSDDPKAEVHETLGDWPWHEYISNLTQLSAPQLHVSVHSIELSAYRVNYPEWEVWFSIVMYDHSRKTIILEDFSLLAHSPSKKLKNNDIGGHTPLIIDGPLNVMRVVSEVNSRMKHVKPTNWDEFYEQMSAQFIYEE